MGLKIGDKVKFKKGVLENYQNTKYNYNTTYEITSISEFGDYYRLEGSTGGWRESQLDLVKNTHKHAELMKAYADDCALEIQVYEIGEWRTTNTPTFNPDRKYRIKPKAYNGIDLELPIMAVSICKKYRYLLLPQIQKGCYDVVGYNWFDVEEMCYNSVKTWNTKEKALDNYKGYTFKNVDLTKL